MNNFNFIRSDLSTTFDFSKRKIINNNHELKLPSVKVPTHPMDELRVRNFISNPPQPRQIPEVDMVEQERLKKYGEKVDIDPNAVAGKLASMVLKLPRVDLAGNPVKDETGRMTYRYYTFKEMLQHPFLRQFRMNQLAPQAPDRIIIQQQFQQQQRMMIDEKELLKTATIRVNSALTQAHTNEVHNFRQEVANNPNYQINISNFNAFSSKNRVILTEYVKAVLDQEKNNGVIYLALINFVVKEYGINNFSFSDGQANFVKNGIPGWRQSRNIVAEKTFMIFTPEEEKQMIEQLENGTPIILTLDKLQLVQRKTDAVAWVILWKQFKNYSFHKLQTSFCKFIQAKKGKMNFDFHTMYREFLQDGGIDKWYNIYIKDETHMLPAVTLPSAALPNIEPTPAGPAPPQMKSHLEEVD